MFRGFFADDGVRRVPYLRCDVQFPDAPHLGTHRIDLLVDTGADRTTLSRGMAESIGLDLDVLPDGGTSTGFGGVTAVRMVESHLSIEGHMITLWLRILESRHPIPSVLGRRFYEGVRAGLWKKAPAESFSWIKLILKLMSWQLWETRKSPLPSIPPPQMIRPGVCPEPSTSLARRSATWKTCRRGPPVCCGRSRWWPPRTRG